MCLIDNGHLNDWYCRFHNIKGKYCQLFDHSIFPMFDSMKNVEHSYLNLSVICCFFQLQHVYIFFFKIVFIPILSY